MKRAKRMERNKEMFTLLEDGRKVREIAELHELSVDSVYRIFNLMREQFIEKKEWDEDEDFDWRDITRLAWVTKAKMLYALGWSEREIADMTGYSQSHIHRMRKYFSDFGYANTGVMIRVVADDVKNEDGKRVSKGDYTCQPLNEHYCGLGDGTKTYFVKYNALIEKHQVVSCFLKDGV